MELQPVQPIIQIHLTRQKKDGNALVAAALMRLGYPIVIVQKIIIG